MQSGRFAGVTAAILLVVVILCACGNGASVDGKPGQSRSRHARTVTIKGSDTLVILAQRWAEVYMRQHRDVEVDVSGGGTGTGIAALINGTTDIATASRAIKAGERKNIEALGRGKVVEHAVALDAIVIYVHPSNPIASLSFVELKKIFRGKVTSWSVVGGPPKRFVLYSRENNSGTYAYFKEHVLEGEDFAAEAQTLPGTAGVIYAVGQDPYSIGYGGVGYAQKARMVPIASPLGDAVMPTLANAQTGRYPLSRDLYMYSVGTTSPDVAAFIQWIRSSEGQRLVSDMGFFPLNEVKGGT